MASPLKSLSMRSNNDGMRESLHVKVSESKYRSIANFSFKIVCHVRFPKPHTSLSGWLLNVRRIDGEEM